MDKLNSWKKSGRFKDDTVFIECYPKLLKGLREIQRFFSINLRCF